MRSSPSSEQGARALLAALGGMDAEARRARLGALDPQGWHEACAAALDHNLGPLLHADAGAVLGAAPEPVRRTLGDVHLHASLRAVSLRRRLAELLGALAEASVPTVVLKGAWLAEAVYPAAGLRPMSDLDILVPVEGLDETTRVMLGLGYRWQEVPPEVLDAAPDDMHHLPPMIRADSPPVEIHRALVRTDRPPVPCLDGVWSRVRRVEVAGAPAWALSPEDLMIHLALHAGVNHAFRIPILALRDMAACASHRTESPSWSRLREIAEADGTWWLVREVLHLVRATTGARIPDDLVPPPDEGAPVSGGLLERYVLSGGGPEMPVTLQQTADASGIGPRVAALLRAVWPSRSAMARIYGVGADSWKIPFLYLRRPVELAVRGGGWVAAVAARSDTNRVSLQRDADRRVLEAWLTRSRDPDDRPGPDR